MRSDKAHQPHSRSLEKGPPFPSQELTSCLPRGLEKYPHGNNSRRVPGCRLGVRECQQPHRHPSCLSGRGRVGEGRKEPANEWGHSLHKGPGVGKSRCLCLSGFVTRRGMAPSRRNWGGGVLTRVGAGPQAEDVAVDPTSWREAEVSPHACPDLASALAFHPLWAHQRAGNINSGTNSIARPKPEAGPLRPRTKMLQMCFGSPSKKISLRKQNMVFQPPPRIPGSWFNTGYR